ncbi:endonuclease III [Lichenifustis flavocetrariae]|uniref:Endonuclease III n=1 Tax=Lichenifustis flavocetrariae TaxID=2949735 RepID=A0AA41YUZ3_9HYPH|nr:endonuclease III [Lichenifustis flavocetrariae]MCW6507691.1 endonuclease III [Lichenifustis flavocetrariae]
MPAPNMKRSAAAGKSPAVSRRLPAMPPDPADAPRIAEIFRRFEAREPVPVTELNYRNAYTLLVAVALSAQATDVSVNKATAPLFAMVDTPQAMLDFGEDRLRDAIKTIGLYNSKARNVMALSERLVREFDGTVPRDRAVLETLPGVGRKTAAVVVNTLHGDHTIAVDTHVFRVSNRMPIAVGVTPDAVEAGLLAVVPAGFVRHAHHWLILHGRYTCLARKPLCPTCIVADLCRWPDKTA